MLYISNYASVNKFIQHFAEEYGGRATEPEPDMYSLRCVWRLNKVTLARIAHASIGTVVFPGKLHV